MFLPIFKHRKSVTPDPNVQKSQELQAHYESELARRDAIIADLRNKITHYEERNKSFSARWQQLIDREHKVEERERLAEGLADSLVSEWKLDLERRERNLEETVSHKVAAGIRGEKVGINKNWEYLFRKERFLNEVEQKMYARAKLLSDHLGVPLDRILTPREKKIISELSKKFTENCRRYPYE